MSVRLNPYLSFRDNAREAMTFYQSVFGGDLTISTFEDLHASMDPSEADLVMHSVLTTNDGVVFMASDTPNRMSFTPGTNFSMSLSGNEADDVQLRGYWSKLSDGGTVTLPLDKAIWGDVFGMCTDKFGVPWLVNIAAGAEAP